MDALWSLLVQLKHRVSNVVSRPGKFMLDRGDESESDIVVTVQSATSKVMLCDPEDIASSP